MDRVETRIGTIACRRAGAQSPEAGQDHRKITHTRVWATVQPPVRTAPAPPAGVAGTAPGAGRDEPPPAQPRIVGESWLPPGLRFDL
jgi:hypothetical protein